MFSFVFFPGNWRRFNLISVITDGVEKGKSDFLASIYLLSGAVKDSSTLGVVLKVDGFG